MDHARIVELLEETGAAHHSAFAASDGADPDWPLWYAEHLRPLLDGELTVSELVHRIVSAELERRADPEPDPWPEVYARRLAAPPEL